ncbi:DUF1146 family protein [Streptococcus loxodontisalivarius]|uniref:Integral membrane protein (TIGR02327 family) n=1 Tax=Streptococcus loxodontisalivarius TaxID=1349415 RepID=A0ABS2PQ91_9STRE|nr:DUF1146 family protein [Streptococcus loxodontisalivarius]MBM7642155.1 putative integral membrane protein (TIGR02327 family) [Streptococcus loxodontisalivarius]
MEIITNLVTLTSHAIFILIAYQLLSQLFDWSKLIKNSLENSSRLNLLLIFFSIALGYMVSSFLISVIQMSQEIFRAMQ